MPLHDGTGPLGFGSGSGREKGGCYTRFGYRRTSSVIFNGRPGWLPGIAVSLVAAVLRDILNPFGMIRRIFQVSSAPKIKDYAHRNVRDAENSENNVQSVPVSSQRKTYL